MPCLTCQCCSLSSSVARKSLTIRGLSVFTTYLHMLCSRASCLASARSESNSPDQALKYCKSERARLTMQSKGLCRTRHVRRQPAPGGRGPPRAEPPSGIRGSLGALLRPPFLQSLWCLADRWSQRMKTRQSPCSCIYLLVAEYHTE